MNTAKILQQYILIKPNTLHNDGGHYQALRSLENAPTLITGTGQFITKNVMPNTDSSSMYGTKRAGKASNMSRRNARERRRVKLINMGYETLRHHVPAGIENRKLSKVDTLRSAVDYIKHLQTLLESTEDFCPPGSLVGDKEKNTQNIPPTTNEQLPTASLTSSTTTVMTPPPKIDNNAVSGNSKISDISTNSRDNQEIQKSVVKDEKMFIDIAEWLCNTSSVLHNGTIKIEGIDT